MLDLPSQALIGVIHLPPLPGSPMHHLPMEEIVERAVTDAQRLRRAGFDAAVIENFGDAPFTAEAVAPATVACMTVVAEQVRHACPIRIGINVLRNDARSAIGIASATGASFVRVNVLSGVYATDQGIIESDAHEVLRYRKMIGARVAILADVHVKHASPVSHADITEAARDTAYRGLADGLIVTGSATGEPVDPSHIMAVREAVPDRRLFVGSGATVDSVADLLSLAGGVIVGSGVKAERRPDNPIDEGLANAFARAAGRG
ncbi:MAG: BtpA/SgcQ family protein [Planctomycetota bacterium]|jgi:membrane complex biogenesis BtpA family protein